MGAFFAYIADPSIGGTYMTLLNTLSNFGGTYPQYFVLSAVDWLTIAECETETDSFSCVTKDAKLKCKHENGVCTVYQDGYYITSAVCVITAITLLVMFIRPNIMRLERIPPKLWRLKKTRN
jgi:MFS transporter, PAT family, solute carrier family 33 (acetyl-CoA transportor), member 1